MDKIGQQCYNIVWAQSLIRGQLGQALPSKLAVLLLGTRMFREGQKTVEMKPTDTAEYWRVGFTITKEDITYLYEYLLESGIPQTIEELTRQVMENRVRVEAEALEQEQRGKGAIYRPKNQYTVGDRLRFPALDGLSGVVVGVRPGENPDYGQFRVIQVKIDGTGEIREFAAEFNQPHPLNEEAPTISLDDLYRRNGSAVARVLRLALEDNPEFVSYGDVWFLRDLLPEVHIGQLNIAEAVIDMAGEPLSTEVLLKEVELPATVAEPTRVFALNLALAGDERFANVGNDSRPRWALAEQWTGEPA